MSSLLAIASLLCALLKVGYEVFCRTSLPLGRRSISGTTTLAFRDILSAVADLGESLSRLLDLRRYDLVELSLVLDRCFSREEAVVDSRSRSLSFRRRRCGLSSSWGEDGILC